jgi:Uma2 family endonuclease
VQGPITLGERSEPQPDLAVLRWRPDFYAERHPMADDVLLIVEVMDTSGEYDRRVKLSLYGRHHIGEVWLVDLPAGSIEVHRQPDASPYRVSDRMTPGTSFLVPGPLEITLSADSIIG